MLGRKLVLVFCCLILSLGYAQEKSVESRHFELSEVAELETKNTQNVGGEADHIIYWQTYHRPPGIIKHGTDAGKGFVQLILNEIIKEMPEFQHVQTTSTLARALEDMKSHKNVCHPSLMKNSQRESFIAFSQSSLFNPANYVITRSSLAQQIQPHPVDIAELVHNSPFTFVVIKGRAFGEIVDKHIATLDDERVMQIASDSLSVMFHLIALGRIDVTIAYPFEFEYFTQHQNQDDDVISLIPIANMPRFIHGSIACSKTPWGEKVIAKVDKILTRIKPTKAYQQAMTRWWPESILDKDFETYYHSTFLNR